MNITGAETGVRGEVTYKFKVTNSIFQGCINGIDLVGMQPGYDYIISDNTLTGIDDGRGITITGSSCDGVFSRNAISHFNTGANFIMSSPIVSKCKFTYNKYYGIVISGNDALPILISTEDNQPFGVANCTIEKNAYMSNTSIFPSAQIGIIPVGSVYMRYNDVISSPNFLGISIAQKDIMDPDQIITIDATLNYWGTEDVTDDYFFGHPHYIIKYDPTWSLVDADHSLNRYISTESRILINALNLEAKDKLTPAIKLYEHIIKKYVDSPEYYVALARLPYLYEKAELDNNELITLYNEAIQAENTSHKKFFMGRKVATHIKGTRYDDAILVAEAMKNAADNEEEMILADINIGIANMLKNTDGKGRSDDQANDLRELIAKLYGKGDDNPIGNPLDITESSLPSQHTLYQNYPNPFNPVTQIKFALKNTSDVKLSVYNISGQKVAELANGTRQSGVHTVDFDGSKFNSGVYYYTLEVEGKSLTQKMILMK